MTDAMLPQDAFDLQVAITRPELVAWLASLPADQLASRVEQTLATGHQVLTFIEASASDDSMQRMFRPVLDRMSQLDGRLQSMLTGAEKSQKLGKLGEHMVASQLQQSFPNDTFSAISDQGHQADIKAVFDLGGAQAEALIEVKLYNNDVPSAELEKFRKDLREQRQRYGLMVSLGSRLTGISGPFHLEATGDYLALFIPSADPEGVRLYWGATLLKALMQFERLAEKRLRGDAIEQAWARLKDDIAELDTTATDVGKFREQIRRVQKNLQEGLDGLVDQALAAEAKLRNLANRLALRVQDELQGLPVDAPLQLPPAASADEVAAFLTQLDPKDKRTKQYRAVWEAVQGMDLAVALLDGEWLIVKDGRKVAETSSNKAVVSLRFPIEMDKPVTFLPNEEEVKKGAVEWKVGEASAVRAKFLARG